MVRRILQVRSGRHRRLRGGGGRLYFLGARIVLDGGGGLHVGFVGIVRRATTQIVEQHRKAQDARALRGAVRLRRRRLPAVASASGPAPVSGDATAPTGRTSAVRRATASTASAPLITTWPVAGLTPIWKQPVGEGYASFVVARRPRVHDRATGRTRSRRGLRRDDRPRALDAHLDRRVSRVHGRRWPARDADAGPTARLYALGGKASCVALDAATGPDVWRTNILDDAGAANLQWGMAAVAARRRRHGRRASGRQRRQVGRRLRPPDRQARLVGARRAGSRTRRRCSRRSPACVRLSSSARRA